MFLPVSANPRKESFIQTAKRLGMLTGLKACFDLGDATCYPGTGTQIFDLSGTGTTFDFGGGGAAPTFNGSSGGKSSSEFLSFDGGDSLTINGSNPAWVDALHQDNAVWGVIHWSQTGVLGSGQRWLGTDGGVTTNHGIVYGFSATNVESVSVRNGSGSSALSLTGGSGATVAGTWEFRAMTLTEATGAGGIIWRKNATTDTDPSTYTSPSASAATYPLQIGAGGNNASPMTNGSKLGGMLLYEGSLPTNAQIASFFQATRRRYGI